MKKVGKLLLSLILIAIFCVGLTGKKVNAQDTSIIYGDETITRAEWLHNLTIMFDMVVEENNMPDDYFSDVNSSNK